ncbi:MAG: metallophosphoesterase family protein [Planctomycetota bacterium]
MIALISDLHSNMEAIEAVLADIAGQGIDRIVCLGDVIGYGPEPVQALRLVEKFELCLRGNHEEAVLYVAEDFNDKAREALDWTRDQLNDPALPREDRYALWGVLGDQMKVEHRLDSALLVHGSPRDPIREYILPRDARDLVKMGEIFDKIPDRFCFVGHSHVPGIYPNSGGFLPPSALDGQYVPPQGVKVVVNVGSVGQPRDGDPRACYATWDGAAVRFRRVEYDFRKTMEKIRQQAGLADYLADRLEVGR